MRYVYAGFFVMDMIISMIYTIHGEYSKATYWLCLAILMFLIAMWDRVVKS